jgi:hypothetical protein
MINVVYKGLFHSDIARVFVGRCIHYHLLDWATSRLLNLVGTERMVGEAATASLVPWPCRAHKES